MKNTHRYGRINVKIVVILVMVVALAGGGFVIGHYVRKTTVARKALAAGQAAVQSRDWPEAIKQLKVYLSKYPDNSDVLAQYAEANLAISPPRPENLNAAINAYRRLLRARPGDKELCQRLVKLYFAIGDYVETAYVARQRLSVQPDDAKGMVWLGRALMAQRKFIDAQEQLTQFLSRHENGKTEIEIYGMLSDLALQSDGNAPDDAAKKKAFKWLDDAVKNNPQSVDALVRRARFYQVIKPEKEQVTQNSIRARADLEAAGKLQSADRRVHLQLAEQWLDLGDLDRSENELETIKQLATNKESEGKAPEQLEFERQELTLSIYRISAVIAWRRGNKEQGVQIAEQGLKELTENRRVNFLWYAVHLYLSADKINEARAALEEYRKAVIDISKRDQGLAERLALLDAAVANSSGKPYVAISQLENVVAQAQPRDDLVWKLLGYAYAQTGQERRAVVALTKYVNRNLDDLQVIQDLARMFYRRGDWENVRKFAQLVERKKPQDPQPKLMIIEADLRSSPGGKPDPKILPSIISSLMSMRRTAPRNVEVRVLQSLAEYAQGKNDQAEKELESAVAECDRPLPAALQWIELLKLEKKPDQAIQACKASLKRVPDSASLLIALADLQFTAGKKDDARKTLEEGAAQLAAQATAKRDAKDERRAKLLADEATRVQLALARSMLMEAPGSSTSQPSPAALSQRQAGIALLKKLAAANFEEVDSRLFLLQLPEIQKDNQEAQRLIDEIRSIESDRGLRWRYEQAQLLLRIPQNGWKPRAGEIIDLLSKCVDGDIGWTAPVVALGTVYEIIGKESDAEDLYRRVTETNPNDVQVVSRLLELLERQRRYVEATKILDRMPRMAELMSGHVTKVAIGRGELDKASKELQARITRNPNDAASRVLLARLSYEQNHDLTAAMKLLDEAQKTAPDFLAIASTRVAILHGAKQDEQAQAVLNAEVDRRKDYSSYLLRAEYFAANRNFDQAEKDYQQLTTFATSAGDGYRQLGSFYERIRKDDKGIAAYDAGLKADPGNKDLQRALVRMLVTSTDPKLHQRGLGMLDDLMRNQKEEDPALLSVRAFDLMTQQKAPEALALFERVVEMDPHNVAAHIQLIRYAAEQGETTKAAQLAARSIGANPENTDLLLVQAGLESDMNNTVTARELAQKVLQADPKNVIAMGLLVQMSIRAGELAAAEKLNSDALKIAPDHEEVQLARAQILDTTGHRLDAIKSLEAYRQTDAGRESVKTMLAVADLYRMTKDYAKCEQSVGEAEKLAPGSFGAFLIKVRMLSAKGQLDEALKLLPIWLKAHPNQSQALISTASILADSGKPEYLEQAKPMFQQYVATNPRSVEAQLGLAILYYQTHDMIAAAKAYENILKIEPYHREALNNLAWIKSDELKKHQDALETADKGCKRYPDDPNLLNTRGCIYFQLDQYTLAKDDFRKCLKLPGITPGTRAKTLVKLGQIAIREAETANARALFTQALEIDQKSNVLSPKERAEVKKIMGQGPTSATAANEKKDKS